MRKRAQRRLEAKILELEDALERMMSEGWGEGYEAAMGDIEYGYLVDTPTPNPYLSVPLSVQDTQP